MRRMLVVIASLIWFAVNAGADVTIDATTQSTAPSDTSTKTASITINASSNLVLVFVSGGGDSYGAATVAIGAVSGTRVGVKGENSGTNGMYIECWKVVNPPTGAQTITVTSATTWFCFGAMSFLGSDGTVGTAVTGGSSGASPSVTVTSATGNMVVDGLNHDLGVTCASSGQTVSGTATFSSVCYDSYYRLTGQRKNGASSVAMGWSISGGDLTWIQIGVDVHASAAATARRRLIVVASD